MTYPVVLTSVKDQAKISDVVIKNKTDVKEIILDYMNDSITLKWNKIVEINSTLDINDNVTAVKTNNKDIVENTKEIKKRLMMMIMLIKM